MNFNQIIFNVLTERPVPDGQDNVYGVSGIVTDSCCENRINQTFLRVHCLKSLSIISKWSKTILTTYTMTIQYRVYKKVVAIV